MKRFSVLAALAGTLLSCAGAQVQEAAPGDILHQAAATYRSLESYASEGTTVTELEVGGSRRSVETAFTMRLAKPNRYLITWSQKNPLLPGMEQRGAVWSDGTQPHLFLGAVNAYARMGGDCVALGGATGVSGGAALTIPSLFLPVCGGVSDAIARIVDPVLEGREKVGDEECFVVSGASMASRKETLWISTRDRLIRKYRRSLEPPEGGLALPEMSDAQVDQALEATGQEKTDESRKQMRESIRAGMQLMKALPLKGTTTEVHSAVRTAPLGAPDFAYTPPAGATLKTSLFEMSGGSAKQSGDAARKVDAMRLALGGRSLSAQEAEALEKRVSERPDDVAARAKLLGYYSTSAADAAKRPHVLWLIENAPESDVLGLPFGQLEKHGDPEGYRQGKEAWLAVMQRQPQNLKVLANAARYFLLWDRDLARETLENGRSLDGGNPRWAADLGQSWLMEANRAEGARGAAAARNALERYEEAYRLSAGMEKEVLVVSVAEAALAAGDRAKADEYARMLLETPGGGWNRGNNLHKGNIILGRLALQADDVEEAKRRLLGAGRSPGSPQLGSFGPNMALARDLLQKGERDTVLQYFELCAAFWGSGTEKLRTWTAAVKENRMPEFGANLVY